MALINCPDCQQSVSDAAQVCIHCGRPLAITAIQPGPALEHPLFPVSTHKFIVLSLCSINLYLMYWCYQNWSRIRARTGESLSPFWRSFFAPFWAFSLFRRIDDQGRKRGVVVGWSGGLLASAYLVLYLMSALPDPWWLITLASIIPFIPVVQSVRQINATAPAAESDNESYSGANVAAIVLGGLILVLAIVGTFLPKERLDAPPDSAGWRSMSDRPLGRHPDAVAAVSFSRLEQQYHL